MPRISRTKAPAKQMDAASAVYNTAIYARLSIEDRTDKESGSIENQIYIIRQYIEERPYLNLCGTFTDNGETGTNFDRDGFNAMMDEVKAGRINCIVVKDLSRFGRNYVETGEYLEKIFPFMGTRFISINDALDNGDVNSNTDALIISLKNLINDVYAKDISQKIISALRTKQERGDYIGGLPPYGYKKSPDDYRKLIVDDEVAHIVRDIFKWKAEGIGDTIIARRLNEAGVPSPMKRKIDKGEVKKPGTTKLFIWRDRVVAQMTINPMYIGHMTQGKTKQALCENMPLKLKPKSEWIIVENTHEAIVDMATFEKAQEMRKRNTKDFYLNYDKSKHIHSKKHLFQGLLVCGDCGSNLVRKKFSKKSCKGPKKYSFVCPTKYKSLTPCDFTSIKESVVFETALSSIKAQVKSAVDLSALVDRLNSVKKNRKGDIGGITKQMANLQNEMKRLTNLKATLFESYAEKLLSEDEYIYGKERYRLLIDEARATLERLQEENVIQSETLTPHNKWLQAFRRFTDHDELTHEMVKTLISRVIIRANKNFEFVWNYKDDYEALSAYAVTGGNAEGIVYTSQELDAGCFPENSLHAHAFEVPL
jgi:DNA invertase Pin-like site-specific DNA recombinase